MTYDYTMCQKIRHCAMPLPNTYNIPESIFKNFFSSTFKDRKTLYHYFFFTKEFIHVKAKTNINGKNLFIQKVKKIKQHYLRGCQIAFTLFIDVYAHFLFLIKNKHICNILCG